MRCTHPDTHYQQCGGARTCAHAAAHRCNGEGDNCTTVGRVSPSLNVTCFLRAPLFVSFTATRRREGRFLTTVSREQPCSCRRGNRAGAGNRSRFPPRTDPTDHFSHYILSVFAFHISLTTAQPPPFLPLFISLHHRLPLRVAVITIPIVHPCGLISPPGNRLKDLIFLSSCCSPCSDQQRG